MISNSHSKIIEIILPYNFTPRDYQLATLRARFLNKKQWLIDVLHRRAGKTILAINLILIAACQRTGLYFHALPTYSQAHSVVWTGIDEEGKRYIDHIPRDLIASINQSRMEIHLINGSIIKLIGSDNYDRIVGTNPCGIVFDEYALANPLGWDYLSPVLIKNGGWAYFIYTPRGRNHGYTLYESAVNNPDWHAQLLTIHDTKNLDGTPLFQPSIVEDQIKAGQSREIVEQEYLCSFEGVMQGAYYSEQIRAAYAENRIGVEPVIPQQPIYTFWDLGKHDSTAIWFLQPINGRLRMVYYYENQGRDIAHYADFISQFQQRFKVPFAKHFAPFDIKQSNLFEVKGRTRRAIAREHGIYFLVVSKLAKEEGISCVRAIFKDVRFDKQNCKHGLRCLTEYHREWDDKHQCYADEAAHDWASHGADAFRYFALAWNGKYENEEGEQIIQNAITF